MKLKFVFPSILFCVVLCPQVYAKQSAFEGIAALSSGIDPKFLALLFFFSFIAVLPTFHMWDGGQNGS